MNLYFFDHFNAVSSHNVEYSQDREFYFPSSNEHPPASFQQGGRLITHGRRKNENVYKSVFAISMAMAQRQIQAEVPFFADSWHAQIIRKKAEQFQLESLSTAQCRPPADDRQKHISVIISKRLRQPYVKDHVILKKFFLNPLIKMASISLTNGLLDSGVNLCQWNAEIQGTEPDNYAPEAMMHLKTWAIDGSLAYIGTANWLARSRTGMLGDMEIGLLTNDPEFVREIQSKILWRDIAISEPSQKSRWNTLFIPIRVIFSNWLRLF